MLYQEVTREAFATALYIARCGMSTEKALCVTLPEHNPETRYYLDPANNSGFALAPYSLLADYLCGVFRHPDATGPVLPFILEDADRLTDKDLMLDCFDGLTRAYEKAGFAEEYRVQFDPAFKPDGWDVEAHGTPDVVFMSRANALRNAVAIAA